MLRKIKQKWSWFKCLLNPKTHFVTQKEFVNQFSNSILDRFHENNRINERISDYDFRLDYLLKENKELRKQIGYLKTSITTIKTAQDKLKKITADQAITIENSQQAVMTFHAVAEKLHSKIARILDIHNEIDKLDKKERAIEKSIDVANAFHENIMKEQQLMLGRFENALNIQGKLAVSYLKECQHELMIEMSQHAFKESLKFGVKDDTARERDTTQT